MDLKSFIIGSSLPVFALFFLAVRKIDPLVRNFSYQDYTLIAPLYLGLMNLLGGILFSGTHRYLYTGLLSGVVVALAATLFKSYNFETNKRWYQYYLYIILKHIIVFSVIIQTLSNMIAT